MVGECEGEMSLAVLRAPQNLGLVVPFLYNYKTVHGQIVHHVERAAWPPDFKCVHTVVFSKSKKNPRILRRTITHPAFRLVVTFQISGNQFQRRSVPIAIAFRSDQPHCQPVISRRSRLARTIVSE